MRQLCFGGSFNPIHYGHLRCARAAAIQLDFQCVVLIPSGQPPHKRTADQTATLAEPAHRVAMCRLATEAEPDRLFAVDDAEVRRPELSYTLDTARLLKARGWGDPQRGGRIAWLIGADQLNDLPTWHRAPELLEEVHFVVMARPGFILQWPQLPPAFQKLQANVVTVPQVDISATMIRQRVARGELIEGLTPPAVVGYIRAKGLYRQSRTS